MRQYNVLSTTSAAYQDQDIRSVIASPDSVVSSVTDIEIHQKSYVDNDRQHHNKVNLYFILAS